MVNEGFCNLKKSISSIETKFGERIFDLGIYKLANLKIN